MHGRRCSWIRVRLRREAALSRRCGRDTSLNAGNGRRVDADALGMAHEAPDSPYSKPRSAPARIAWGAGGLVGVQLPGAERARRAGRGCSGAFPARTRPSRRPRSRRSIARIAAFLGGARGRFRRICRYDFGQVSAHSKRAVYREARAIPAGETSTYGAIAARLGDPGQAARSARRSAAIPGRSSFPATGSPARTAGWAASPRRAAGRPS